MHACMLGRFICVWLGATPWIAAHQAPLSMGFSRQEYWSGLPWSPLICSNSSTSPFLSWPWYFYRILVSYLLMLGGIWGQEEKGRTGWDGWMASPTQWTWVWVNSRSWWWTGRPGVLRFMGSHRDGHDWATELNWSCRISLNLHLILSHD